MKWIINNEDIGKRLDVFLQQENSEKTRSHIKHWIDNEDVKILNYKQLSRVMVLEFDNLGEYK